MGEISQFKGINMTVFKYFNLDENSQSIYRYAPVYTHVIENKKVIIKKTKEQSDRIPQLHSWQNMLSDKGINTVLPIEFKGKLFHPIDDENWVVYPFIDGEVYEASSEQIYMAGDLLGKVHSCSDSVFAHGLDWEDYDQEFFQEVLADFDMITESYPQGVNSVTGKALFDAINSQVKNQFACLVERNLPFVDCTWDYKASNLIFRDGDLVLIDTDNAGSVPRIFDLALALLLFHTDAAKAPARPFDKAEWACFLEGYLQHVQLTELEKSCWQNMLLFVFADEVLWAINDMENDEPERQKRFIASLVEFNFSQYKLG